MADHQFERILMMASTLGRGVPRVPAASGGVLVVGRPVRDAHRVELPAGIPTMTLLGLC